MDHSVRVWVGLSLDRGTFWVGSVELWSELISSPSIFGPIYLSCKSKQFAENFGSGMAQFVLIRVSDPL